MPSPPNPIQAFVSAHANSAYFQPVGGQVTLLAITGSTWDEEINTILVTNTVSGALAARIANVLDGKGTINADYDLNNSPYINPPSIFAAQTGLILIYISPARFFQVPCIVKKLHFEGTVQDKEKYSFDVEMNSLAGLYVRPLA